MSHSLSNKAARAAAKKKLLHAFSKSRLVQKVVPVWNDEYKDFKAEIWKSNPSWLRDDDIDTIIVLTYLEDGEKSDGLMVEVHTQEFLNKLADKVIDFLAAPNDYWFHFPMPQISLEESIELSDSVVFYKHTSLVRHTLLIDDATEKASAVLKVRGKGYVFAGRTQSAFVDAMTKAKWALQIASLYGYLRRVPKRKAGLLATLGGTEQADIYEASWTADKPIHLPVGNVRLALGMSKYLAELAFTEGEWTKTKSQSLQRYVGEVFKIIVDPTALDNVKSIRRSLEWAFDAQLDEDEHMRFMKTCIGLEAAISEQNDELGITEQLADRCAFLLNKTAASRQETRETMRKIYKLRSKLVHGAAAGLTGSERSLAVEAERTLEKVLSTELKAVMEWYRERGK